VKGEKKKKNKQIAKKMKPENAISGKMKDHRVHAGGVLYHYILKT